jgi:hypothetical protein
MTTQTPVTPTYVGEQVATYCREKRIPLACVADRLGLDPFQFYRSVRGDVWVQRLTPRRVERVADALEVAPEVRAKWLAMAEAYEATVPQPRGWND